MVTKQVNILVIGNEHSGRSSLCETYINGSFDEKALINSPDSALNTYSKSVKLSNYKGDEFNLSLDIKVPRQPINFSNDSFIGYHIYIICCCKHQCFQNHDWYQVIHSKIKMFFADQYHEKVIALCLTKCDIDDTEYKQYDNNDIDNDIINYCKQENIFYCETSAKYDIKSVDELFGHCLTEYVNNYHIEQIISQKTPIFVQYNLLYDILSISVSIADLLTDLLILIEYYEKGRITFFILSMIIIVFAQLAYSAVFTIIFSPESNGFCRNFANFIFCIPVAPLLSYSIYMIENYPNSWFVKQILEERLCFEVGVTKIDPNESEIEQWITEKLRKHCGFILESFVEAFPNSIVQMIAIVYYNEADVIAIISIIISMLSVSTKCLIFSKSINPKIFIFNWLCCVTDFFAIFFSVSWVFYKQSITSFHDIFNGLNAIGTIYVYKILIGILPFVVYFVGCTTIYFIGNVTESFYEENIKDESPKEMLKGICQYLCILIAVLIGLIILFVIGVGFGCILLEIFCFTLCAITFIYCDNFPDENCLDYDFWNNMIAFVMNNTGSIDKKLRIISCLKAFNSTINEIFNYKTLRLFIQNEEEKMMEGDIEPFGNISYHEIQTELMSDEECKKIPFFWRARYYGYKSIAKPDIDNLQNEWNKASRNYCKLIQLILSVIWLGAICYLFIPFYILSRIINICFPFIIIGYVGYYNIWNEIDHFQYIMLITYIMFFVVLICLGIHVKSIYHTMWYLAFGNRPLYGEKQRNRYSSTLNQVNRYYMECKFMKLRQEVLEDYINNDIARIVCGYLPNELCNL